MVAHPASTPNDTTPPARNREVGQEVSGYGNYAQLYDSAGAAVGSEFLVNSTTTGNQAYPAAAMDADGDFVIAWQSDGQDGSSYGVYAQRYTASGETQVP